MKKFTKILLAGFIAAAMLPTVIGSALAQDRVPLANSYDDWSSSGTQGYKNWYYKCLYPTVAPDFAYDMTWPTVTPDHWILPEWGGLPAIFRDHSITQGGGSISSCRQWKNTSVTGSMHVVAIVTPTDALTLTAKLLRNNTQVLWSQDISSAGFHGYDFDVPVSAGDALDFAIDPRYDLNGVNTANRTVYDKVIFSIPALTGHIDLQNYAPVPYTPVAVVIELIQNGSTVRKETVVIGADGNYLIPNVTDGTYDVAFKASSWLRKVVTGVTVNVSATCNVSLTNGDVDGDNNITSTDLSTVLANIDGRGD